jgi:hypothetical protein
MSRECDSLGSPQFASSVIAAVEPAPVHRRILYTITDVPLKAGRLIAGASTKLIIATARQQHQRRRTERDFDDGEHTYDPLSISLPIGASIREARKKAVSCDRSVVRVANLCQGEGSRLFMIDSRCGFRVTMFPAPSCAPWRSLGAFALGLLIMTR